MGGCCVVRRASATNARTPPDLSPPAPPPTPRLCTANAACREGEVEFALVMQEYQCRSVLEAVSFKFAGAAAAAAAAPSPPASASSAAKSSLAGDDTTDGPQPAAGEGAEAADRQGAVGGEKSDGGAVAAAAAFRGDYIKSTQAAVAAALHALRVGGWLAGWGARRKRCRAGVRAVGGWLAGVYAGVWWCGRGRGGEEGR